MRKSIKPRVTAGLSTSLFIPRRKKKYYVFFLLPLDPFLDLLVFFSSFWFPSNFVWVLPSLVSQRCPFFYLVSLSCNTCYSFMRRLVNPRTHFFHVRVI